MAIQLVEILRKSDKSEGYLLVTRFSCKLVDYAVIVEGMRSKQPNLLKTGDHVMVYTLTEEYDLK